MDRWISWLLLINNLIQPFFYSQYYLFYLFIYELYLSPCCRHYNFSPNNNDGLRYYNTNSLLSSHQRNEKISNKSSFGIIDIAESSTTDRIIVIVDTACFIHDGACRWRVTRHVNVSASH